LSATIQENFAHDSRQQCQSGLPAASRTEKRSSQDAENPRRLWYGFWRMTRPLKLFALLLLLLTAQHGAIVHELGHLVQSDGAQLKVDSARAADATCALCPAFAQVVTPAFTHAFQIPLLGRAAAQRSAARRGDLRSWIQPPSHRAAADLPPSS
jgi:hypothetical protein